MSQLTLAQGALVCLPSPMFDRWGIAPSHELPVPDAMTHSILRFK